MKYDHLIDSSAWMENFSGTKIGLQVEEIIQNTKNCTTIMVVAELADKFCRESLEFQPFFDYMKSKSSILAISESIALRSAEIKKQLRKSAPDTSLIDAINLAAAREVKAKLVTCDSDFSHSEDVILIQKS